MKTQNTNNSITTPSSAANQPGASYADFAPSTAQSPLDQRPEPSGAVEISTRMLREWSPLLKPNGIGLLLALHTFEESTPTHPFFGWAHCTQTSIASYLDSSQDTIARYTNLLLTCGLLQVDEVETSKGKQKLYRVTRGVPLPSLGLLEYLIFDADQWTRKHTAWLLDTFVPMDSDAEFSRLLEVLKRAYKVKRDSKGVLNITSGARLTVADSYLAKRVAGVQASLFGDSPSVANYEAPGGQVPTNTTANNNYSASCGQVPPATEAQVRDSASCGQVPEGETNSAQDLSASCGVVPENASPNDTLSASCGVVPSNLANKAGDLSASCGQVSAENEIKGDLSASCGVVPQQQEPLTENTLSAPCGVVPQDSANQQDLSASCGVVPQNKEETGRDSASCGQVPTENELQGARDSASCGQGSLEMAAEGGDSASCGQVPAQPSHAGAHANVNVKRLTLINDKENVNVNVTDADAQDELESLVAWGAHALGDNDSLDWHRRCIARYGAEAYRQAISTTQRAIAGGKVANAGAYFTGVLKRSPAARNNGETQRQLSFEQPADEAQHDTAPEQPATAMVVASTPPKAATYNEPDAQDGLTTIWQAALLNLRIILPGDDYNKTLRYATLLELDRVGGWALLGLPNEYLCEQVRSRLAAPIKAALRQVCGVAVDVAAAVAPGQGRLAGSAPTLSEVLANRAASL